MVFLRPTQRPPVTPGADTTATAGQPSTATAAFPQPQSSAPSGPLLPWRSSTRAEEREVTVRTSDYEAVLSTRGAVLRSFTLLGYPGRDSAPVQMVRDSLQGELGMTLLARGATIDLSKADFGLEQTSSDTATVLTFTTSDSSGTQVVRRYSFPHHGFAIEHEVSISGADALGEGVDYQLEWSGGLPVSEKTARTDLSSFASVTLVGQNLKHDSLRSMKPGVRHEYASEAIHWTGVRNRYFISAIVPQRGDAVRVETFGSREAESTGTEITMPVLPGQPTTNRFLVYIGPLDYQNLRRLGYGLDRAVNLGWNALRWLAVFILEFLARAHKVIPNYGWLIVILSALTKLIFYPLTRSSLRSMAALQKLKPEMDALKEKHKNDSAKLNQATMELYKKHRVNPMGGCLPILVQMPVFIALYNVLANAVELRRAAFLLWIRDLSAPDTVGHLFGFPINILPLVMTATTILQQKLTPTDPRQAAMGYMMPVVMLVFFYSFPSGLVIYWTVNNALQIAQQWWIRRHEPVPVPVEVAAPPHRDQRRRR
jgi:YidC/Oxa1 family membrane protein insertase